MPKPRGRPDRSKTTWSVAVSSKVCSCTPVITRPSTKNSWEAIPTTAIQEKAFFGSKQNKMARMQERTAVAECLIGRRKGSCFDDNAHQDEGATCKVKKHATGKEEAAGFAKGNVANETPISLRAWHSHFICTAIQRVQQKAHDPKSKSHEKPYRQENWNEEPARQTKSIRQHNTSTSHKDVKHGHHCSPERNSLCSLWCDLTHIVILHFDHFNRQRFCRHGLEARTRVRWDGSRLITHNSSPVSKYVGCALECPDSTKIKNISK